MKDSYGFEQYEHHGVKVWVRNTLLGAHREYCLCYDCEKFHPYNRKKNCRLANRVYAFCVAENLVLPVWECPDFVEKEIDEMPTQN